jgi:hypothetical protein
MGVNVGRRRDLRVAEVRDTTPRSSPSSRRRVAQACRRSWNRWCGRPAVARIRWNALVTFRESRGFRCRSRRRSRRPPTDGPPPAVPPAVGADALGARAPYPHLAGAFAGLAASSARRARACLAAAYGGSSPDPRRGRRPASGARVAHPGASPWRSRGRRGLRGGPPRLLRGRPALPRR